MSKALFVRPHGVSVPPIGRPQAPVRPSVDRHSTTATTKPAISAVMSTSAKVARDLTGLRLRQDPRGSPFINDADTTFSRPGAATQISSTIDCDTEPAR